MKNFASILTGYDVLFIDNSSSLSRSPSGLETTSTPTLSTGEDNHLAAGWRSSALRFASSSQSSAGSSHLLRATTPVTSDDIASSSDQTGLDEHFMLTALPFSRPQSVAPGGIHFSSAPTGSQQ